MRLSLDSSVKNAINDDISEKIEYYGGKRALNNELANINLDVGTLKSIYIMEQKYSAVYEKLTGDGGLIEPTADEVAAYYAENYSRIKYIVFYTTALITDDGGNQIYDDAGRPVTAEMSDTELAEKEEKISECISRIGNGEDFDGLAAEYSEYDTSAYKNGFYISFNEVNTWGEEIITGANAADDNSVFRVNEDYAVYIVKKLPLTPLGELDDSDISQLSLLNTYVKREKAEEYFAALRPSIAVDEGALAGYSLSDVKTNPYYGF
ncbi:MAG: peptidylprolyl isomerase, partial [Clostridia bacterium]|nr:peptidylprolyl isomerase [Clostridia bacterium]